MIGRDAQAATAEKPIDFMGITMEVNAERGQLDTKRLAAVQKSNGWRVKWPMNLHVSFERFNGGQKTVNEAEIYLLSEELPIFTQALITHPILLPTSYAQHLSMERGMYCVRLNSTEPFDDFAARLSDALNRLG